LMSTLALGGGSVPIRARALEGAGMLHVSTGEQARAIRLLEEAVALRRQAGDRQGLNSSLNWLGNALIVSDPERASVIHAEVLESRRASGDERGVAGSLVNLGLTALARDDTAEAAQLLDQAASMARSNGDGYMLTLTLTYLAWTAVVQGDDEGAARWLREGMASVRSFRHMHVAFLVAAVLTHAEGRPRDAIRLIAAADAAADRAGRQAIPFPSYAAIRDEHLGALRAMLGEEAFAAAWVKSQALGVDAAFALALSSLDETAASTPRTTVRADEHSGQESGAR
jgi:tetratricopeptide (TPR) repeat protein